MLAHAQVVRDHDPTPAPLVDQARKRLHDLVGPFGVQGGRRLIGQDQCRIVDQRPGDCHALLLTAGHLARQEMQVIAQPQPRQRARAFRASPRRKPFRRSIRSTFSRAFRNGIRLLDWNVKPIRARRRLTRVAHPSWRARCRR